MKTSKLIELLKSEDPNDECVVCVNNHPVRCVEKMQWYYDGTLEFFEKDENGVIVKAGYKSGGYKMKIFCDSLEDVLCDNPNLELDLSGIMYNGEFNKRKKDIIDKWIKEGKKFLLWRVKSEEARKQGVDMPPVFDPPTFKEKLAYFFKKIGLIDF